MKRSAKFFVAGYLIAALGLYLGSGVIGDISSPAVSRLSFIILALGYGVIGGIGLGTGYVTSVSTVAGWFPDKKGFATGMIVMGFGIGALFMSKVFAPFSMQLASNNVAVAFLLIAGVFAVIMVLACRYIYSPHAAAGLLHHKPTEADNYEPLLHQRIRLWLICFTYSLAGLGIISLLSPLMQNVSLAANPGRSAAELAAVGATLIAIASIGNSVGRLSWAWISDVIGRVNVFIIMLGTSAVVFLILPQVASPIIFSILICYVIASYGGCFGTIPSLISDLYGAKRMSTLHGLVLTGWATAGLTAPPFFGYLYDKFPDHAANYVYYICAGALLFSTALAFSFKHLHKHCIMLIPAMPSDGSKTPLGGLTADEVLDESPTR